MGEPNHRVSHKSDRNAARYAQEELFATDVLLIAERAGEQRRGSESGSGGEAAVEPLNMENVVRRLIALLDEQQS